MHPSPSREPVPRPPTRSLKGASASDSGSRGPGRRETRASLFPQHNPSAAGRALVLITPHPPWPLASPTPLKHFPAASRNVASPNPATHRWRALQPPAPPPVFAAAKTAAAAVGQTPLRRLAGSAPVLVFRHVYERNPFGPRAEQEGELFCRGLKPETAFLAERPVGEEQAAVERGVNVALRGVELKLE